MGKKWILILKGLAGTPGRIRTCDLLLRRQSSPSPPFQYLSSFLTFPLFRGFCFRSQINPFPLNSGPFGTFLVRS